MNETSMKLQQLQSQCDEKKQKKYKIQTFINLCNKVEDKEDLILVELIRQSYDLLFQLIHGEDVKSKEYRKSFIRLQKTVRDLYGFTAKGQIRAEYTGMGIAIGVAMGAPFSAINPGLVGIGLPIGLAIGAGIGDKKEKEAEAQNKVY